MEKNRTDEELNAVVRALTNLIETDPLGYTLDDARTDNQKGWDVELSRPLGSTIWMYVPPLSDHDLTIAYRRASLPTGDPGQGASTRR